MQNLRCLLLCSSGESIWRGTCGRGGHGALGLIWRMTKIVYLTEHNSPLHPKNNWNIIFMMNVLRLISIQFCTHYSSSKNIKTNDVKKINKWCNALMTGRWTLVWELQPHKFWKRLLYPEVMTRVISRGSCSISSVTCAAEISRESSYSFSSF